VGLFETEESGFGRGSTRRQRTGNKFKTAHSGTL
jgi:hypothetical protein